MRSFDVSISGSGFVANALALLLAQGPKTNTTHRRALRIALSAPRAGAESANAHEDIRVFSLNRHSRATLSEIGVWDILVQKYPKAITPVRAMQVYGDAGGALRFVEPGNWMVQAQALLAGLEQRIADYPSIVRIPTAGLGRHTSELAVISEGKHSELREQLGARLERIDYGHAAIAARLRCQYAHQHIACQWFGRDGRVCALLPMGGAAADACEMALVWSMPMDEARALHSLEAAEFVAALQAQVMDSPAVTLGAMTMHSARTVWPLQCTRVLDWVGCRDEGLWVLAGDSAHAIHPLSGQGLNLGLADAQHLAHTLHAHYAPHWRDQVHRQALQMRLQEYARARKAASALMQQTTDGLQVLFAQPYQAVRRLRNAGMHVLDVLSPAKHAFIRLAS